MSFSLGIFHVDVYPDGTRFENVCDAISAAWLADDFALVEELAREYGLYNQVCLRCVKKRISYTAGPTCAKLIGSALAYQLCDDCLWTLTQPARSAGSR